MTQASARLPLPPADRLAAVGLRVGDLDEFWRHVHPAPHNRTCWLWTGERYFAAAATAGHRQEHYHGRFTAPSNGRVYAAWRLAYYLWRQDADPELRTEDCLRHMCAQRADCNYSEGDRRGACVNPSHLLPGTVRENAQDRQLANICERYQIAPPHIREVYAAGAVTGAATISTPLPTDVVRAIRTGRKCWLYSGAYPRRVPVVLDPETEELGEEVIREPPMKQRRVMAKPAAAIPTDPLLMPIPPPPPPS